jgi:hypothetical protein
MENITQKDDFTEKKPSIKKGCLGCSVFSGLFLIVLILILVKPEGNLENTKNQETDFSRAFAGDYWLINDEVIVFKEPQQAANKAQVVRNTLTIISPGTKIEILERKGILDPWLRVYIYNKKNEIYAEGWIFAATVEKSVRTEKGLYSP